MTKHISPIEFKDATEADPAEVVTKALDDLSKTVDDRLSAIETKTADRLDKIEAKVNRPAGGTASDDDGIETKSLNSFFRGEAVDGIERKTLQIGGSPATGTDLVAPEYLAQVIDKLTQFSPLRSVASVMSVGAQKVYIPRVVSKLAGSWVTEIGSRSSSNPTFEQVEIDNFEYAVIVPVSRQLLEDSMIDLAGYLAAQIGEQFGKAESTAFMTGDGSGKPTGLLHTPSDFGQTLAKQDGTNIIDKLIALFYSLPNAYASRGNWLMNRATQGVIRAAADNATKGTLWSDSLANGTPATFLGRPVLDTVDMDNLVGTGSPVSATYPVAFGDYSSAYQIVDRVGLSILRDDYTGASNGIVNFHARRRVGGKVIQAEAVKLLKATVTGS
jgi:HK97 family phage major capsid protein